MTRLPWTAACMLALLALGGCADAPLGLQVRISPSQPTQDDDLVAEIAQPPADVGDEVTYTYRWFIEGNEAPGLTDATLPAAETGVGEVWRVVVIPTVSGVSGEVGAADVLIREADTSIDADGDGEPRPPEGADCDDEDPTVYPGAEELCDGIDNDCDEAIDEGFDGDGDGVTTCEGDCDDDDQNVAPGLPEECDGVDNDCSGVADDGFPDDDGDGIAVCADCDDGDASNFPDNEEICDGRDNNCDGGIDEAFPDVDGDGFTCDDCSEGAAWVHPGAPAVCDPFPDNDCDGVDDSNEVDLDADGASFCDGDCDDGSPAFNIRDEDGDGVTTCGDPADCDDLDPNNYPGNTELCDGFDNDCDGAPESSSDADGDGVTVCAGDCDDNNPSVAPGQTDLCDGLDNDCNGVVDDNYNDSDADGVAYCVDCDDTNASVYPGAPEICDAADNNCDGAVDEGFDADGDGYANVSAPGCLAAWGSNADCDDTRATVYPGAADICDGILDNNCDGIADTLEADTDGDGLSLCNGDCDDTNGAIPGQEVCDGLDNNCNTQVDEGFDADGDGVVTCGADGTPGTADDDCDDGNGSIYPGAPDVCDGVIDNNCDFVSDPLETDDDGDGTSECAGDCDDTTIGVGPGAMEDPSNGVDDDCDGLVDEVPPPRHFLELNGSSSVTAWSWNYGVGGLDASFQVNPTGNDAQGAVLADFDGDGWEDMVVQTSSFFGVGETTLLLGDAAGGFTQMSGSNPLSLGSTSSLIWGTGDVDNDGLPDVIGWDWSTGEGWIWLTDPSGPSWTRIPGSAGGPRPFNLQYWNPGGTANDHESVHLPLVDVDQDGNVDIVECSNTSTPGSGTDCSVHSGAGDGTFTLTYTFSLDQIVNGFAIADFDGDGALDLLGGFDDDGEAGLSWLWTGGLSNWAGSGAPSIDVNPSSGVNAQNAPGYGWAYPMDADQDGDMDVILSIMTPFGSNNRILYYVDNGATGLGSVQSLASSQGQHGGSGGNGYYIIQNVLPVAP